MMVALAPAGLTAHAVASRGLSEWLGVAEVSEIGLLLLLVLLPVPWPATVMSNGADSKDVTFQSVEHREGIPTDRIEASSLGCRCSQSWRFGDQLGLRFEGVQEVDRSNWPEVLKAE